MAQPTLTEVYSHTRSKCGDTEVSGGQIYTDTLLLPHIQEATRALWRGLRNLAVPRVKRTFYYTLAANTSFLPLSPETITADFSQPADMVAQRGGLTSVAISNVVQSGNNLVVTTSSNHNLSTGDIVVLEQIGGIRWVNVLTPVVVDSSTQITVNGLIGSGTYTVGGYVVTSNNEFDEVPWADYLPSATTQSTPWIAACVYANRSFQFAPSSENRQLRIQYWSSSTVPAIGADVIAFDDCIDFISMYAGAEACESQGAASRAAKLRTQAVGPGYDNGIIGGELRSLMSSAVRQMQLKEPYARGPRPFRAQPGHYSI